MAHSAEASRVDKLVGTTVADRFEILAFAAAGGMGRVYRALDRRTSLPAAVKIVSPSGDPDRFAREVEVLAAIDHPSVVRYLANGTMDDGAEFLAMEWLTGEDLSTRLDHHTLDVGQTLSVARIAADALAAAHARGIVHRDLKPANLFLVDGKLDAVKLLDFGIARALSHSNVTISGTLIGTPAFMAPEQVSGRSVDPRVDVYGLGAVIFCCLTGHPPFRGAHPLAVLAKVLLEPPPSIRDACPEVPSDLEALIERLLAKDPAQRPADGAALAMELRAIGESAPASVSRIPAAITAREQRVASVVLCAGGAPTEQLTLVEAGGANADDEARQSIEKRGGVIAALARGAWVVTIPNAASPAEQATRAARCALALSALRPSAPLFIATGRVLVAGEQRVGEVIDRAAEALVQARDDRDLPGVRVDAATAELLEGRFRITGDGAWRTLGEEEVTIAPVRTLLGKPAPCVGRDQQLAILAATLNASADDAHACAIVVTAPAGLGKTRLVHELLRVHVEPRRDIDVLSAGGDPMRASSPFGIVGQIIKRAAGIFDSDGTPARAQKLAAIVARDFPAADAQRTRELLGEICGVLTPQADASAALRAARADVSIMADAVRDAWTSWIAARTSKATVLLVVEDLHWADASSMRLIEAALATLEDRPLVVLATSRPDANIPLSDRFRGRGLVEVSLAPLSTNAAERLVRGALGAGADDALVRALARRSSGHPFHLEELVRAAADGRGADALPDSVLGMVQARLDELGVAERRVLRAASVFGDTFWTGGVTALMGDDVVARDVRSLLASLVAQEVITESRSSKWRGETEYKFRHVLIRDAAYATLAEPDRVRAHRFAAAWLESIGESEPAVLAEHYDLGGAGEKALGFFHRAASHALHRNDFDRAISHASRARALGPDAAIEAALRGIEAEVSYWRGDLAVAADRASGAAERLTRGAPEWFDAVSVAVGALGQLGRNDSVAGWLDEAAHAPSPPESRGAHVVALCRGMTQLFWAHHGGDLSDVRACLDELVERTDPLDAFQSGWVHRVRGESAWLHARDVGACLRELEASCAAFERARASRALCLTRLNTASLTGWSGAPARGLELVAQSRAEAEHLGAGFLVRYGSVVEAMLLTYAGDDAADAKMRAALADVGGSPRLSFLCNLALGWMAIERGDLDAADAAARAATSGTVAEELRPAGLALVARVACARGNVDEAVATATEARRIELACPDLELTYGTAAFALAEAYEAKGALDEARAALAPMVRSFSEIAASIATAEARARFWARKLPNAEVARLAAKLGIAIDVTS